MSFRSYCFHYRVMLTGGNNNNAKGQTTAKIYNIGTSGWSNARAMNQKRLFHGCASVTLDDGSVMGVLYGRYVNSMMKSNFLALRLASGLSGQDTFFPFDSSERTLLSDLIMLAMA